MGDYRAYILGREGHRFVRVEDFASDYLDDAAAVNAAKPLADKHEAEVWDGGRLVARLSLGGEVMSPSLVPSLILPSDTERKSAEQSVRPISLRTVSQRASSVSIQDNPFLH
jgi:hypothetical protein